MDPMFVGHYIPYFAAQILANNEVSGQAQINLKGIMVSPNMKSLFPL
jgi:carboxypeptidase C (cathepsin A)